MQAFACMHHHSITIRARQLWPAVQEVVPHFRHLPAKELNPFEAAGAQKGPKLSTDGATESQQCRLMVAFAAGGCHYALGWCFTTIICEQRLYLPWLLDRVLRSGVTLQHRSVESIQVSTRGHQAMHTIRNLVLVSSRGVLKGHNFTHGMGLDRSCVALTWLLTARALVLCAYLGTQRCTLSGDM